jgi:hypothetical protein
MAPHQSETAPAFLLRRKTAGAERPPTLLAGFTPVGGGPTSNRMLAVCLVLPPSTASADWCRHDLQGVGYGPRVRLKS